MFNRRPLIILTIVFALQLGLISSALAQDRQDILPIEEVKEIDHNTKVYGYSTLGPEGVQKFEGRYLGVLTNSFVGPGHHLIVVELEGNYFKETGVIAGQSGSPVTVRVGGKEKIIGTISYGGVFSKNPIAFLTPIEEVLDSSYENIVSYNSALASIESFIDQTELGQVIPKGSYSVGIAAPAEREEIVKYSVRPGSVLAVQVAWGDFDYSGSGTVSYVDGNKVYMFGHPFFQLGPVNYRLVPAKVLGVQASYMSSGIIAAPIEDAETLGVITQDRTTGIYGVLGQEPEGAIPVTINLTTSNGVEKTFNFHTISDSWAGPQLIAIGTFASVSSWSRAIGNTSLFVHGTMKVGNSTIEFNNAFVNNEFFEQGFVGAIDSLAGLVHSKVAAILTNSYSRATIDQITLNVKVFDEVRVLNINGAILDSPMVKSGDSVELSVHLSQPRNRPMTKTFSFEIPRNIGEGIGRMVVGSASAIENMEKNNQDEVSLAMLMERLNQRRKPDAIYVYVIYPPSPVNGNSQREDLSGAGGISKLSKQMFSNIEEYEMLVNDFVVNGSREIEFRVGNGDSHP